MLKWVSLLSPARRRVREKERTWLAAAAASMETLGSSKSENLLAPNERPQERTDVNKGPLLKTRLGARARAKPNQESAACLCQ